VGTRNAKIELHIHAEGAVRPALLRRIANSNHLETSPRVGPFRDLPEFLRAWEAVANCLRTPADLRDVVTAYADEARMHGAVYVELAFTPIPALVARLGWAPLFDAYCDGAEAASRDGLVLRLTPEICRGWPAEFAEQAARHAVARRERGVVGFGLAGLEGAHPVAPLAKAVRTAVDGGLGFVPHAGEVAGPESVREVLAFGPRRIRHGIRAVEDPDLLAELAERGVVLDVCPTSNVRTGAVSSLDRHPLPILREAGVACSVSTDDPALFDTDLSLEYRAAAQLGHSARDAFAAGMAGALWDDRTRAQALDGHEWAS
jgi:aminodeoxyfutalosine deaminase